MISDSTNSFLYRCQLASVPRADDIGFNKAVDICSRTVYNNLVCDFQQFIVRILTILLQVLRFEDQPYVLHYSESIQEVVQAITAEQHFQAKEDRQANKRLARKTLDKLVRAGERARTTTSTNPPTMTNPVEHMSSVIPGSRSRSSTPARREQIAAPSSAPNGLNASFSMKRLSMSAQPRESSKKSRKSMNTLPQSTTPTG